MQELAARIRALLTDRTGGPVDVGEVRPLPGGACQDLFAVEIAVQGGAAQAMVLRSDAASTLPGSISREREYAVIQAARRAGVATPQVRWLARHLVRKDAWAYFMDWVDGIALGGKVTRSPSLAKARQQLPRQLAHALAAIHRITPEAEPELPLDPVSDPVGVALDGVRAILDGLPQPSPAFELVFRWLDEHRPPDREVVLTHGDYRVGNFMVGPAGLNGVLDWEFAHWGSPWQDLGFLCTRDWRFGVRDKAVGGIARRSEFYRLYAEASGRHVDAEQVRWWEVYGNLGWGAGALSQTERYLRGADDFELLAIGRRAMEMAWEALRLAEEGADARPS